MSILGAHGTQKLCTLSTVTCCKRFLWFVIIIIVIIAIVITTHVTSALRRQLFRDLFRVQQILHEKIVRQRLHPVVWNGEYATTHRTRDVGTGLLIGVMLLQTVNAERVKAWQTFLPSQSVVAYDALRQVVDSLQQQTGFHDQRACTRLCHSEHTSVHLYVNVKDTLKYGLKISDAGLVKYYGNQG